MTVPMRAVVKSVLSGDTVILKGRPRKDGPPAERQISLSYVSAPRLASPKKDTSQEPFAFESREYLRRLIVGKEVGFKVNHTTAGGREYGAVFLGDENIVIKCVEEGWCSLRDEARFNEEDGELVDALKNYQASAKENSKGIWNKDDKPTAILSNYPEEPRAFLNKYKGQKLPAIIEQVRDGSTIKINIELPGNTNRVYQTTMFHISGIKAPVVRKGVPGVEDLVEPFGEEAKYFLESRLLQKDIHIILEGLNNNNLCGSVLFSAGDIAEALVGAGLAKVVDWSITLVSAGPAKLRAAEKAAKEKKLRLWKDHTAKAATKESKFEGTVVRIATADQIHVLSKSTNQEKKIQFSSIRAPKLKDPKEGYYANEAKEHLRKLLIGKTVQVSIDYIKPAADGFDERHCATVTFNSKNVGELLVTKGLAFVIRHKKDDDNRASAYDSLLIAEESAKESLVGVHSNKEPPIVRTTDASESVAKAKQFVSFFQRSGKINAVVEHVSNAARFRLAIPSQNCKLTFVLGGVRAPKVGRTPQEPSEPFGAEAYAYSLSLAMQRDVEIEVESTDKVGGFIGTLWVNGKDNLACKLLEKGYATIHDYSASLSPYTSQLMAAERVAKESNLNIWTTIKEAIEEEHVDEEAEAKKIQAEKVKLVVSDMPGGPRLSVQILSKEIQELERLMAEFSIHHSSSLVASSGQITPRAGLLCSAQSIADKQWYRARVRKILPGKSAEVVYLDFGNSETLSYQQLRPLPEKFAKLSPQAMEARLAYLHIPELSEDYGHEAFSLLRDLIEGREFDATIEVKDKGVAHLVLFTEPKLSMTKSVNSQLVKEGFGVLLKNKKMPAALRFREHHIKVLSNLQEQAKKAHVGMWEYGEVAISDEEGF